MKGKKLILFACLFFFENILFAAPPNIFDMILVGDPVLEDLRYISLESGKSFLSFTPPLAPAELKIFLDSIDESLLSEPAREAFYRIKKRLKPTAPLSFSGDLFSVFLNINSNIEVKARTNTAIEWYPEYPKISPLISLPLKLFFADSFQLYVEPSLTMDTDYYHDANYFGSNATIDFGEYDFSMPLRAFMALGGGWWNFQIGRDRLSWGTGEMGNLTVSDNPDYYDFLRLSVFSKFVKYSVFISQMPMDVQDNLYTFKDENFSGLIRTMNRYFYLHRIDVNLFQRFSVSLMEGLMVGNSPLEIRYLNPITIFHSLYSSWDYDYWPKSENTRGHMNGSIFSIELNWNILKSLAIYGQFVTNEFTTPQERTEAPPYPPDGLGHMAGIRYNHSFDSWASVFFFEYANTTPYLYVNSSPFASFIHMRYLSDSSRARYTFIGYSRDLLAFTLGANFFKYDILKISGLFSILFQGEHDIKYDWERSDAAFAEKNPSGIVERKYIASLSARWKLNSFLAVNGSLTGLYSQNNSHVSGSNETGLQSSLSISFSY